MVACHVVTSQHSVQEEEPGVNVVARELLLWLARVLLGLPLAVVVMPCSFGITSM